MGKPVHVFDMNTNRWFSWRNGKYVPSEQPSLSPSFAGIGSRDLTEEGRRAISSVFANKKIQMSQAPSPVIPSAPIAQPASDAPIRPMSMLDRLRKETMEKVGTLEKDPAPAVPTPSTPVDPKANFNIVKLNFRQKAPKGVVSGMRNGTKDMSNTKPGEDGWLGNPFKANDVKGGTYTRQEATELFGKALRERASKDPEFAAELQKLRGGNVGYYAPDEEFIHLQEETGAVKRVTKR